MNKLKKIIKDYGIDPLDMDLGNGLSFAILMALGMKESKIYEYLAKNKTPHYYLNDILKDNDLL